MSDRQSEYAQVVILADDTCDYVANGPQRLIPCTAVVIRRGNMLTTPRDGECGGIILPGRLVPAGSDTVAAVQLKVPDNGSIWIKEDQYEAFKTQCNSCCIPGGG